MFYFIFLNFLPVISSQFGALKERPFKSHLCSWYFLGPKVNTSISPLNLNLIHR